MLAYHFSRAQFNTNPDKNAVEYTGGLLEVATAAKKQPTYARKSQQFSKCGTIGVLTYKLYVFMRNNHTIVPDDQQ